MQREDDVRIPHASELAGLTRAERRQARDLLRKLLPKARALHRSFGKEGLCEYRPMSAIGEGMQDALRIDNLAGLHVYQGRFGGWFADVYLKEAPLGAPRRFGTPASLPLSDRASALQRGVEMIAMVMAAEEPGSAAAKTPSETVGFAFYGIGLNVPRAILEIAAPLARMDPRDDVTVGVRLDEVRQELFGADATPEKVDALDRDGLARLMAAVAFAMIRGYVRWPVPEERGLAV